METASNLLSIILIDLVLSGDNAVVIGMAAAPLTPGRRRAAILMGGGMAMVLRVLLTWLALELLRIPAIGVVGGLVLLWIAFKLLKQEQESAEGIKEVATLGGAILTITVADFVMSVDNVLGVAAAAHGAVVLVAFGLLLSMTIVMAGGSIIASLIGHAGWLAYVGAGVIAWTGAEMVLSDQFTLNAMGGPIAAEPIISGVVTVVVLALAHYLHRHRPARAARGASTGAR